MLAQTLRALEQDGLIARKAYPTVPPKVEYALSPLGRSLLRKIAPLVEWAEQHHAEVRKARKAYVPRVAAPPL
jgi:DNA-binding HxlR family transcriptional regulator